MTIARLLVVNDNQDDLELLTVRLRETYGVFSYKRADEALAALQTAKPDLLLLDIGMRPIDGRECLQAIRAATGYATIPAIALTGDVRDSEREAFKAAGFQAVVTIPILDHAQLFATIGALLWPHITALLSPGHQRPTNPRKPHTCWPTG